MKRKEGVVLAGLDIHMRPVLIHAEAIWRTHGEELVVTSGLDSTHSAGSLHYYGRAVDLRTRFFGAEQTQVVAKALRTVLGAGYDVVVHPTHMHVEYDPDG